LLDHDQIRVIVDVRQLPAVEGVHGDRSINSQGLDLLPGRSYLGGIRIQAVNQVAVIRPQRGGEFSIAATEMNDQSSGNPRRFQDLRGRLGSQRPGCNGRRNGEHQQSG
jgi:hypothetical protein